MPVFSTAFARLYGSDERGPTSGVSSGEPPVAKSERQGRIPYPTLYPTPTTAEGVYHPPR
jgi:hypothetical protein